MVVPEVSSNLFLVARFLLIKILDAIVNKFGSLRKQMPSITNTQTSTDQEGTTSTETPSSTDNIKGIHQVLVDITSANVLADCRVLVKTLVLGLKNIVWGVTNCTPPFRTNIPGQPTPAVPQGGNIPHYLLMGSYCLFFCSKSDECRREPYILPAAEKRVEVLFNFPWCSPRRERGIH